MRGLPCAGHGLTSSTGETTKPRVISTGKGFGPGEQMAYGGSFLGNRPGGEGNPFRTRVRGSVHCEQSGIQRAHRDPFFGGVPPPPDTANSIGCLTPESNAQSKIQGQTSVFLILRFLDGASADLQDRSAQFATAHRVFGTRSLKGPPICRGLTHYFSEWRTG